MARLLEHLFATGPAPVAFPRRAAAPATDVPVRFRPRLIAQLLQDHEMLRAMIRSLLDACRRRDQDACIIGLREVAAAFRHLSLAKATQLYPYLRWALENDRFAARQFDAVQAEVLRAVRRVESIFEEYLDGPWLGEQRQRFLVDVVKATRLLAGALKHEEAGVFPLYLPPGQYRHVRDAVA